MAFEGPRGIVPSALAGLPMALGLAHHNQQLVQWGESILAVTVVTILVSVFLETLWTGVLNRKLLGGGASAVAATGGSDERRGELGLSGVDQSA